MVGNIHANYSTTILQNFFSGIYLNNELNASVY